MSGFTRVHHPETGGYAEVPTDSLDLWAPRGWETVSGSRSRVEADHEQAAREDAEAEAARAEPDTEVEQN